MNRVRPLILAALLLAAAAACARPPRPGAGPTTWVEPDGGVPVLAWHYFKDAPGAGDGNLTESYARFEEMLRFLAEHGFRSAFPEEVRGGRAGDGRAVVLTFDDGPRESLRAAEILERHGFRGIFFVIPNRARPGSERHLTPEELARLARAGHRVSAHGYDHRSLASSGTEVAASLVRSPAMIGEHAGAAAAALDFAFPFGHYTTEVAEAVAGRYRHLHTVNPGYWDGRSPLLPRMLIMRDVELRLYQDYVLGGGRYAPRLEPLTPDGAVAGRVAFRARGGAPPEGVELFAVTADAEGRSYASHPLGAALEVRGDTAWVDLAAHVARWFGPERGVVSYALVTREGGEVRYLSPGVLHWVRDPASPLPPRRAPAPVRADSAASP